MDEAQKPENQSTGGSKSQKKWWLIGCGGCLGVLLLMAVGLTLLGGMGVNALKETSERSIQEIFGKSYHPTRYMPFAFPVGQFALETGLNNFAILVPLDKGQNAVVFALDMTLPANEALILQKRESHQLDAYLQSKRSQLVESSKRSSSSNKIKDIKFGKSQLIVLANGKRLPVNAGVAQVERRRQTLYTAAVTAIVPEAKSRVVMLVAVGGEEGAQESTANADFAPAQKALTQELQAIVQESELDDRLLK